MDKIIKHFRDKLPVWSRLLPVEGRYPLLFFFLMNVLVILMLLFSANGQPVWWHYSPENSGVVKTKTVGVYTLDKEKLTRVLHRLDLMGDLTVMAQRGQVGSLSSENQNNNIFASIQMSDIQRSLEYVRFILEKLMSGGYIENPRSSMKGEANYIYIEDPGSGELFKRRVIITDLIAKTDIQSQVDMIAGDFNEEARQEIIVPLVQSLIETNLEYDYMVRDVVPLSSQKLGFYDIVSATTYVTLIAFLFLWTFYRYGRREKTKILASRYYLALSLMVIFLAFSFWLLFGNSLTGALQLLVLPISYFSSLMVLLYGQAAALRFILYMCGILFMVFRFDPPTCFYLVLTCLSTVGIVRFGKTRLKLLFCSLLQGLAQIAILEFIFLIFPLYAENNLGVISFAFAGGFFSIIATSGILPLFEFFARIPTNYSLLELSNLNLPILRKLQAVAPGTYSHSLNVATLAENACLAIGANGLLARVAAYYHDVGKIDNPEYFIENQEGVNKHDDLKPEVSALIIRNHVKNGLEKARKLRLPVEIIQVIDEHHGSSYVTYFYEKAKTEHKENGEAPPDAKDFMYSGQWPQTTESAIIALADTIEAISHTIQDPTIPILREKVWQVIMRKISEGLLSSSHLTMEDLYKISEDFVLTLSGQYHGRIVYPHASDDKSADMNEHGPVSPRVRGGEFLTGRQTSGVRNKNREEIND